MSPLLCWSAGTIDDGGSVAFPTIGSETILVSVVGQRKVSCERTVVASIGGGSNIGAFQQSRGGTLYFQGKHPAQQGLSLVLVAPGRPAESWFAKIMSLQAENPWQLLLVRELLSQAGGGVI